MLYISTKIMSYKVTQKLKEDSSAVFKEATPVGGGFAGFFSLQAGTVLASTVIFGVALITLFYNLSAPNDNFDKNVNIAQYFLVYSHVCLTCIGAGIVSTCAFLKNPNWLLIGAIFVTVSSAYWFSMAVLSFIPYPTLFNYLCIMDRCPPTHWIFEVPWRRAGTDAYQPHHLEESTTDTTTTDNTTITTTTDKTDGNQTTKIPDVTSPIDLNSGATFPPNATAPLVAVDCSAATIDNEFILKELHDLKPIEKMEKRPPTDPKDDADDIDTQKDNGLYDDQIQTMRASTSDNSSNTSSTTSEATTNVSTTTAVPTIDTTVSVNPETPALRQGPETEATDLSGQRKGDVEQYPLSQQNINDNHNSPYPQIPVKVPEEMQRRRDKQWGVKRYLSSQEVIYTDDINGGNLAMSIICFAVFSIFLVYGIVCMFYLYKKLKRRQRERRKLEEEDEESNASKTSLRTHPSKKSQRSARSQ